jgi:hypothetical protein
MTKELPLRLAESGLATREFKEVIHHYQIDTR